MCGHAKINLRMDLISVTDSRKNNVSVSMSEVPIPSPFLPHSPSSGLGCSDWGSRRHAHRQENETRRRCQDLVSGLGAELWPSASRAQTRATPPVDSHDALPDAVVTWVCTLIQEGALRRAGAALLQEPSVSPTDDVVTELSSLHPAPRRLRSPVSDTCCVAPQVRKALVSFLRPSHVHEALRPAIAELLCRPFSEVISLFLQGEVPDAVSPFVCGAAMMALRKPNGTLRSIALVRRSASPARSQSTSFQSTPVRFLNRCRRVSRPNCCEATIHVKRQWFHAHRADPNRVAVCVDISSAFNSVHRSAVLTAVRRHFPSLVPWVAFLSKTIASSRSVRQEDPLDSVLFALASRLVNNKARRVTQASHLGGIDLSSFCLDDGLCAGLAWAVRRFFRSLFTGLHHIGLEMSLDKTKVIPPCTSSPGATGTGPPLDATGRFPDTQGACCLLRSCSRWCKILYSCRTEHSPLASTDCDICAALGQMTGTRLSDDDWRLVSLGIAAGPSRHGTRTARIAAISALAFGPISIFWTLTVAALLRILNPLSGLQSIQDRISMMSSTSPHRNRQNRGVRIVRDPVLLHSSQAQAFSSRVFPRSRCWRLAHGCARHPRVSHYLSALLRLSSEVLDRWGGHALSCCRGGYRVLRHGAIRDVLGGAVSQLTSVVQEPEKPGLLPPRLGFRIPAARAPGRTLLSIFLMGAAPQMFGFPVALRVSQRLGMSASPHICVPPRLPRRTPTPLLYLLRLKRGNGTSRTQLVKSLLSTFRPWSSRCAGEVGVPPCARLSRGMRVSLGASAVSLVLVLRKSVSKSLSASHAPFTGKTCTPF